MSKFDGSKVDVSGVSCVGSNIYNDRYSLTIPLLNNKNEVKTVIVIMKNPASTARQNVFYNVGFSNITDVDKTTTKLINYLFSLNRYKTIITVNLFPYYSANPQDLNAIYGIKTKKRYQINKNTSYKDNIAEVERIFAANANANVDVICAWGNKSNMSKVILNNAIQDIIAMINNYFTQNVYQITKSGGTVNLATIPLQITNIFYPLHPSKI